jgi:hypothetical protein
VWYGALAMSIVAAYIFCFRWFYEVITRFRQDLREIFELKEVTRTVVIIFVWIITLLIMLGVIFFSYVLIGRLVWFFGTF